MQPADSAVAAREVNEPAARRIVYLLGAGATQGAADFAGSTVKLVMPGLIERLRKRMHEEYDEHSENHTGLGALVNDVVDEVTDFEQLLTFLEDTPSAPYQGFAERLKPVFSEVLRDALTKVREQVGDECSALYAVLVDMHQVAGSGESLAGFLTLNYDSFLEHGIETHLGRGVDYGVQMTGGTGAADPIRVLKLHGSFNWRPTWPLQVAEGMEDGRWIPPGIRKAKGEYPFNTIWGAARELLDCDVLRIIGCNLGPNDWDLVSLLFTTMHGRESAGPYKIEVISGPDTASRIAETFPYLDVSSLLEIDGIGSQSIGELLGSQPKSFLDLDSHERKTALENARLKISNPFEHWLRVKGELMLSELGTIATPSGLFEAFVETAG